MRLLRVGTRGFRNLAPAVLEVDAPLVVFWGGNGTGKTNWLEAVGVLGTLRSFRTSRPQEMIAWGSGEAGVEGLANSEGMTRRYAWSYGTEGRSLRREDRAVDAVRWLQSLRASSFVPEDTAPVRGEPALRRAMLDRAVLTLTPAYLGPAREFRRILEQKAALLRMPPFDVAALDVVDEQLARASLAVVQARRDAVRRMHDAFSRFYVAFGGDEGAAVRYRTSVPERLDAVVEALHAARSGEAAARRPLVGPQRDDLVFALKGQSARAFASQGQARSLVLAWKLAELDAARADGETPLFLLDDLGSELDPQRSRRLVELLGTLGAQVFLTTTDRRFVPDGIDEVRFFRVEAGEARPG